MSALITLTRHVNHEKMLRRRFLTPLKQIKNEIVGANEAVGNHLSIYIYIVQVCSVRFFLLFPLGCGCAVLWQVLVPGL